MKRFFLLTGVLLVLYVREGNAATSQIKCYQCSSMKSYEDCAVNKTEKQCAINVPGFDWTCGKFRAVYDMQNMTGVLYSHDCVLEKHCKDDAFCKSKRNAFEAAVGINATDRLAQFSCEMHCCKQDLCNAAPSGFVGGFVLSISGAVAALCIMPSLQ